MSTHNSVASSNRRRDSQQSWTGSEIFRSQSPNDVVVQNNSQVKLSGKAWGRIKKFLLCKTDFPSSIYYIVGNEFCERFSYYGMKAILILYLTRVLMLGDDTATAVFHSFSMLCYFTPLFGAMLADGWLGKYRTILYVSVIYCIGNLIVSMTSLPPLGAGEIPGPMIGLFLIALGTGGIKPCVSAFGGDQFTSDQSKLLQSFFSVFYFAINAGSLLSMLITPVLRGDVKCYGDDCYPLAFGVPAALMFMAITLFWFGRNKYKRVPQTDNILLRVTKAVSYALKKKITSKGERKAHWMDWASDRYDAQLIEDIKALFKVLFMFLPLPVFWTLFDQQGSRWVLQAGQMDGDAGFLGTMKPDQMQAFNPLFIIILIPLFETVIYPLLRRPKPLKRMCAGMFLATVAFIFAGFLQMKIQSEEVIKNAPSEGQANLQVINSLDCPASLSIGNKNITVTPYGHSSELNLPVTKNVSTRIQTSSKCYNMSRTVEDSLSLEDKEWYNLIISEYKNQLRTHLVKQNVSSPPPGKAKLCTVLLPSSVDSEMFDIFLDETKIQEKVDAWGATNCVVKNSDHYKLTVKGEKTKTTYVSSEISLKNGGIYTAVIEPNKPGKGGNVTLYKDLEARNVSMLYQIPQYFVITSGEIMFSITGLEFAYSQAPASMKSCLQAAWLMTVAFGNLIVVIEAESRLITNQTTEFFFFAGMLFVVMAGFAVMAKFYRYVESPGGDPVAVPVDSIDDKTGIVDLDELSRI